MFSTSMDEGTIKTKTLKVFNRVYRLEIQSVILVFSTSLVNRCPSTIFPLPKVNVYTDSVWLWGGGVGDVKLCCRPNSAGVYHSVSDKIQNLQIATPPQQITSEDDI
jgi:hypothetical protein